MPWNATERNATETVLQGEEWSITWQALSLLPAPPLFLLLLTPSLFGISPQLRSLTINFSVQASSLLVVVAEDSLGRTCQKMEPIC